MRHWFFAAILIWTGGLAAASDFETWLDFSDRCESVITHQNLTALDGLERAANQININGVDEITVLHPSGTVIASTGNISDNWFLCLVKGTPPLHADDASHIVVRWMEEQRRLLQLPEHQAVAFNDGETLDPVRVRCLPNGRKVVVFATRFEAREFRIGVTDRLPRGVDDPCVLGTS